jgi:hypothetical protein
LRSPEKEMREHSDRSHAEPFFDSSLFIMSDILAQRNHYRSVRRSARLKLFRVAQPFSSMDCPMQKTYNPIQVFKDQAMTLTIELPAQAEARLAEKARQAGIDMPTYVERLLEAEATRPPLEEMLKPIHDAFHDSGMSEEQLSDLLVKAKKEMRAQRRNRRPQ